MSHQRLRETPQVCLVRVFEQQRNTPNHITFPAHHGFTRDIKRQCPAEWKADLDRQLHSELARLGIDKKKIYVHQSEVRVHEGGTTIRFQEIEGKEWKEINITGIQLHEPETLCLGGGASNMARSLNAFMGMLPVLQERNPSIASSLDTALVKKVEVEAILNPELIEKLQLSHIRFRAIPGSERKSEVIPYGDGSLYFVESFSKPHAPLDSQQNVNTTIADTRACIVQQLETPVLRAIINRVRDQELEGQSQDDVLLLMPTSMIDAGIDDRMVQETLRRTKKLSFNLDEAARFLGLVAIEKFSSQKNRLRTAKVCAQKLHTFGVETISITDAEHGAYISRKKNGGFYWKHFPVDSKIDNWVYDVLAQDSQVLESVLPQDADHEITGCGDSFAASIQFCTQVLGLDDTADFVIAFANKIAGTLKRLNVSNIGAIPPQYLAELFEQAAQEYNDGGWEYIAADRKIPAIFDQYEKLYSFRNIIGRRKEIFILIGTPGLGKHELIAGIAKPHATIRKIMESANIRINGVMPVTTDQEDKKKIVISQQEFHDGVKNGSLIGPVHKNNDTYYASRKKDFTFDQGNGDTIDFVVADSAEQAMTLWEQLMDEKDTTRVRIVHLQGKSLSGSEALSSEQHRAMRREKHRTEIAEQSGGFSFYFHADSPREVSERVRALAHKVVSVFQGDRSQSLGT